jgi:hypothetical protein
MGDVHAPDQWALLAFANEAMQVSANHTSHAANSNSGIGWSMVLKGLLPMLTVGLGLIGSYLVYKTALTLLVYMLVTDNA